MGSCVWSGGCISEEVSSCIQLRFDNLKHLRRRHDIRLSIRDRVYSEVVKSILIYDSETWPLRPDVLRLSVSEHQSWTNRLSVHKKFGGSNPRSAGHLIDRWQLFLFTSLPQLIYWDLSGFYVIPSSRIMVVFPFPTPVLWSRNVTLPLQSCIKHVIKKYWYKMVGEFL